MLVQLRRVVYLLVLLQFCLSVCLANAGDSLAPGANANIAVAESKMKGSIHRADKLIAKQEVCVKVLNESVNDYEKKSKNATDAVREMQTHIEGMREFTKGITGVAVEEEKLLALEKQLEEAKPFRIIAGEAVRDAMTSYAWAKYVRDTCGGLSGSMEKEEEQLRKVVGDFRGFFLKVTEKTDAMKQLEEEGVRVIRALAEEKEKIKKYDESNVKDILPAEADLKEMGKAVVKARAYLLGFSGVITEVRLEEKLRDGEKKEEFEKKIEKVEKNVETESAENSFAEEMQARINKVPEEKKGNMLNEIEKVVARQVEERKKEKAENDKPEQEKPGENSDNSNSPALVHSPLLILLLCVLGSILVC